MGQAIRDCMVGSPPITVLLPCRNEARTVGRCVTSAFEGLHKIGEVGEVVVCDNGSTDDSPALAARAGARVVSCLQKGYGNAIRFGVEHARAEIIVMADSDGSYDVGDIGPFINLIRDGASLVVGNRFVGGIMQGAMPWKNRYIGNPVLSALMRTLFRCSVGDAHCGMRAFTRTAFDLMQLRSQGMEIASEQIIRAVHLGMKVVDCPVRLSCDGRQGKSHLRPWRDGLRHVRTMTTHFFAEYHENRPD